MFTRKITATGVGTTNATSALDLKNSAGVFIAKFLDDGTVQLSPVNGYVNLGTGQLEITAVSNTTQMKSAGNWRLLSGSAEVMAYGSAYGNLSLFGGFTPLVANLGGSKILCLQNGTGATQSTTDTVLFYAKDIAPGKAIPCFMTEDGKEIRLYRQDISVTSATVVHNVGGTAIKTGDTFDGYTIAQIVKALRNKGDLQ